MRQGIYRPGRSVQRVTANFGNRAFIRGGRPLWRLDAPAFIGPAIPDQSWLVGTPVSYNVAALFSGDYLKFYSDGLPIGLSCTPEGNVSGTPAYVGTGFATVLAVNFAGKAESNKFAWTVA
jgi:Putative Ig domain